MAGTRSNDAKHSSHSGTRLALVSSRSQILHPAGKNTLTSASLTSAINPRTPRPRSSIALLGVLASAIQAAIYSFSGFN
jgi:hypothetical protein